MLLSKPMIAFAVGTLLSACQNPASPKNEDTSLEKIAFYIKEKTFSFQSQKVVLVGGCFDVLHYGHIQFLKRAKAQGDFLVVALEPDTTILQYKKRKPVHTQQQRAENLAGLDCVDRVLLLPSMKGFEDYNQLVVDVKPAVIAITKNDPQLANKERQAQGVGAKVVAVMDRMDGFSSSKIIQALSD